MLRGTCLRLDSNSNCLNHVDFVKYTAFLLAMQVEIFPQRREFGSVYGLICSWLFV